VAYKKWRRSNSPPLLWAHILLFSKISASLSCLTAARFGLKAAFFLQFTMILMAITANKTVKIIAGRLKPVMGHLPFNYYFHACYSSCFPCQVLTVKEKNIKIIKKIVDDSREIRVYSEYSGVKWVKWCKCP
jgi:hypothetical protein